MFLIDRKEKDNFWNSRICLEGGRESGSFSICAEMRAKRKYCIRRFELTDSGKYRPLKAVNESPKFLVYNKLFYFSTHLQLHKLDSILQAFQEMRKSTSYERHNKSSIILNSCSLEQITQLENIEDLYKSFLVRL